MSELEGRFMSLSPNIFLFADSVGVLQQVADVLHMHKDFRV